MVSMERKAELLDLWGDETNEDWTQEWRDGLNEEELAMVNRWDEQYNSSAYRMRQDICQRLDWKEQNVELNTYKVTLRHDMGLSRFEKDEVVKAESAQDAADAMRDKYPEMYIHEIYRKVDFWS